MTEEPAAPPALNGEVDPESLDPEQLEQFVEELGPAELEDLLSGLDGEILGTLVRAAGPDTATPCAET